MRELGYDLSTHRSKSLSQVPDVAYDLVVTMGCGDECPAIRAVRREDWQIPNPKQMGPQQFRAVRDLIRGGDFAFRFNVLPSDFNGDGLVTLNPDAQTLISQIGAALTAGNPSGPGTVTEGPRPSSGVASVAPMSSSASQSSATRTAVARGIPTLPRNHAPTRRLDVVRFGRPYSATDSRIVDPEEGFCGRARTAHEIVDVGSEGIPNLLAEVRSIL